MKIRALKILVFIFYSVYATLDNCLTPITGSSDACLLCQDNYKLKNDGSCEKCKNGEIGNNNICYKEIKNCINHKLYKEGIKCNTCKINYETNDDQTICYKEINNCLVYENNYEKCIKCDNSCSLTDDKKSCICLQDCDEVIEKNKCTACYGGYYPDNTGDNCISIENCKTADDTEKACTTCEDGCYKSFDGKTCTCVEHCTKVEDAKTAEETGKCATCEGGYYPNDTGSKCNLIDNCKTASDTDKICTTCEDGCYKSTDGKTCTCVENCIIATNEENKCTACKTGCYKSDDGSKCTCVENCVTATNEENKCIACEDGCYSDDYGSSCTCINNCKTADPYEKCTECQSGFYLSSDHESCNQIEHCSNSNVDNKKTCKTCQEGCYLDSDGLCFCIPGCKALNNDNTCTQCNPGWFLDGTSCTIIYGCKANNNDACTECNEGCSLSGTSCICIDHCTQFDDSNNCIQCEENYALSVSGDSCNEIKILNCVSHEKTKNECKKCKNYYVLSDDKRSCEACNDNNDSTKCGVTLPGCKEVLFSLENHRIECNVCNDGLEKTTLGDQCTQDGLYIAQNKKTIAKLSEIDYCIKYATETKCSKCLTGFYIINGKCYPCSDPYESGDGNTCFLPHFNCEEYDDKGKCIKCEDGSVFTKNRQYCIKEGAKDPTSSNSHSLNLNIIILLIFILL